MFLKCIKGHPGILEEEQIYEIKDITPSGHFQLVGIVPPPPCNCFNKERFTPVDIDDINIEEVFEFIGEI
jgi:hypothetical protein